MTGEPHAPGPAPVVAGVATGLVLLAAGLCYQQRRLIPLVLSSSGQGDLNP